MFAAGKEVYNMIIIKINENESIERALKRFKKKFDYTGVVRELRSRTQFEKPSVIRRNEKIKAAYRQRMYGTENY
jgi:small subunit ribosomal protein S21